MKGDFDKIYSSSCETVSFLKSPAPRGASEKELRGGEIAQRRYILSFSFLSPLNFLAGAPCGFVMNVIAAFDENAIIWITLYMGKQDCPSIHLHLPFNSAMRPPNYAGNKWLFIKPACRS